MIRADCFWFKMFLCNDWVLIIQECNYFQIKYQSIKNCIQKYNFWNFLINSSNLPFLSWLYLHFIFYLLPLLAFLFNINLLIPRPTLSGWGTIKIGSKKLREPRENFIIFNNFIEFHIDLACVSSPLWQRSKL